MSRAATEQNLFSLLPGINTLPADLVSLANTLLAQSRTTAPNLRPDEEISRGYAVANIACERCVAPFLLFDGIEG
jgi:origin recognition complex subunit 6